MLNREPQPDVLNLLRQLQESTTEDIDEERGSFKKGDTVTYNMLGIGFTNSDLIKMLGTNEHATRANHDGTPAKVVEAIGEEVARYSIMFEDGFVINDVAASELKSVVEDTKSDLVDIANTRLGWAVAEQLKSILDNPTIQGIEDAELNVNAVRMIYRFLVDRSESEAKEAATAIIDWVEEDYGDPSVLESKTNEDQYVCVRCRSKNVAEVGGKIKCLKCGHVEDAKPGETLHIPHKKRESKTNEAEKATDTMQPQEKPDINAEDYHMEDYSEEDLNKPEAKVKSKSEKSGDAIRQVEDDELEQKPDKVVTPKKESKLQEQKDVLVRITGGEDEGKPGVVTNWVKGLGYQDVSFEGKKKQISYEYLNVGDKSAEEFDEGVKESKIEEGETEFTPSRAEVDKISDEKLLSLYKNAKRSYDHCKKDPTAADKAAMGKQAIERYEEMLAARGITIPSGTSEKQESKFSFMKKQDPLWLCNECHKTFRADKAVCEMCKGENVERITEQYGPGFTKEVFNVTWKNTDTGEEESTRVMAFDKAAAEKEAERPNREITKVKGPIMKEPGIEMEEDKVPFDQSSEGVEVNEAVDLYCPNCGENLGKDTENWNPASCGTCGKTGIRNPRGQTRQDIDKTIEQVNKEYLERIEKYLAKIPDERLNTIYKWMFGEPATIEDKTQLRQEMWDRISKMDNRNLNRAFMIVTSQPVNKESKLTEHVRELVGEVPGIDAEERARLYQAIDDGGISDEWPSDEVMIDALAAKNVEMGATDIDGLDMGDIKSVYLKYILLPRARKATAAPLASESKIDEDWESMKDVPGAYHDEPRKEEAEEDWDLTFLHKHNLIWHNPMRDREGEYYHWQKSPIKGKKIRVFTDYQADWVKRNNGIPVKVDYELISEAKKEFKPITAIEIVRSGVDPDAYNIRVVELPEGSIVILDTVEDDEEAIKRGKEFARVLNAKFLGIIDEKKIEEMKCPKCGAEMMEEEDIEGFACAECGHVEESKLKEQEEVTFTTVAKGIVAKTVADEIATKENGQVVTDEDEEKKFAVIVKDE